MSALRHRTVRFALVVLVLACAWEAYLAVSAPRRVDAALASALEQADRVNIAVTLGFPPEDFHMRVFQSHGIVSGVRGTTVRLNRVTPDEVRRIARFYWVKRIERSPS